MTKNPKIAKRQLPDRADLVKQSERNLRKGNYRQAAAGLDIALRSDVGHVRRAVALRIRGSRQRSAEREPSAAAVDAALTYRVAGLQVTLDCAELGGVRHRARLGSEASGAFPGRPGSLGAKKPRARGPGPVRPRARDTQPSSRDREGRSGCFPSGGLLSWIAMANQARPSRDAAATYERALDDYDRALELAPHLCEAYMLRARIGRSGRCSGRDVGLRVRIAM